MEFDIGIAVAGAMVGFIVGLTGMGGGALMTPMLVLLFGVDPLTAVSTDVVAAVVIKPIGGGVHLRHGRVHRGVVRWLVLGSVPSAFLGVVILRSIDDGGSAEDPIRFVLGLALVVAAGALVVRAVLQLRRAPTPGDHDIAVRRLPTLIVGILGGLIVGMTSVGSGSLMMVLLIVLYPRMTTRELVGTDLVQAVPLVLAAAVGHLLFGDFDGGVATSLLVGAVPAVYVGARLSSRAPDRYVRPVLILVLLAAGLALLNVPDAALVAIVAAWAIGGFVAFRYLLARRPEAAVDPDD